SGIWSSCFSASGRADTPSEAYLSDTFGYGGSGIAHSLRERCESHARAAHAPGERACYSSCFGRRPRPLDPPTAHREHTAFACRWNTRTVVGGGRIAAAGDLRGQVYHSRG